MVASRPVPRPAWRAAALQDALEHGFDALLDARRVEAGGQGEFVVGGLHQSGAGPALAGIGADGILERAGRLQGAQHQPRAALGGCQLQALGQPHGPGDDGREGEADHHRLHHPVGLHEHAPGRQVARQHRVLGGQQAVRIGERVGSRIDRAVRLDRHSPVNRRCVRGRCLRRRSGRCLGRRRIGRLSPSGYRRDRERGNPERAEESAQTKRADHSFCGSVFEASMFGSLAASRTGRHGTGNRRPAFAPVLAYMRMPRNINKSRRI